MDKEELIANRAVFLSLSKFDCNKSLDVFIQPVMGKVKAKEEVQLFVPESKHYRYSSRRRKKTVINKIIRKHKGVILLLTVLLIVPIFFILIVFCAYNSYSNLFQS